MLNVCGHHPIDCKDMGRLDVCVVDDSEPYSASFDRFNGGGRQIVVWPWLDHGYLRWMHYGELTGKANHPLAVAGSRLPSVDALRGADEEGKSSPGRGRISAIFGGYTPGSRRGRQIITWAWQDLGYLRWMHFRELTRKANKQPVIGEIFAACSTSAPARGCLDQPSNGRRYIVFRRTCWGIHQIASPSPDV
ncbi:hypothetical protein M569_09814 [Genlisea aurea]|uniref:Uncharacterized protein n=1 Tax=Genlisea aurea TaxID=192259 RepID=S8CDP1_9LAMI|nr:hypothetical protein M569_09814 [Genlisea aurea]